MSRQACYGAVLAAALSLVACGRAPSSPPPAAGAPQPGGTLTATMRSEPQTFNRYAPNGNSAAIDTVTRLVHATLVRVDRTTGDVQPWLAEKWSVSPDQRTYTLTLRDGITFSDGVPLTADDVVFSFRAVYDPAVDSVLASGLEVQGKPLAVSAADARTVVITLPAPFAPGLALLDNLPIYPKHQLQGALDAHTFAKAWGQTTAPGSMAGLGPFVVAEFVPGQRVVLARNPHYWRKDAAGQPLPYLDRLDLEIVPAQDAEVLRIESGSADLMAQADVRPEDYAALRRLRDRGSIQLIDVGTGVDPSTLWFNLAPSAAARAAKPYLQRAEFRQAIAFAVDRDAIARTVYLGAAVPVYGPVTPGNKTWYSASAPQIPARRPPRQGAARRPRAVGPQSRRHARGRGRAPGALLDPHPGRQHP